MNSLGAAILVVMASALQQLQMDLRTGPKPGGGSISKTLRIRGYKKAALPQLEGAAGG